MYAPALMEQTMRRGLGRVLVRTILTNQKSSQEKNTPIEISVIHDRCNYIDAARINQSARSC